MLQTSARLLQLLSLFQARRYWSGAELAGRLEVNARTLRRDVDRLRSLGYPVNSTSGAAGGYQLGAGSTLPPLLLEDDEALAVAVGLRTAASGTVTGIEEASLRALSKLEQVLPSRLRRRLTALHSFIVPLGNSIGPTVDANTLSTIATACRDQQQLRFAYSGKDSTSSRRLVEPHRLVYTGRKWYLVAWDTRRDDWRTFRVDRVLPPVSAGSPFIPRTFPEADLGAYVSRSLSYAPYPCRAVVTLHASLEAVAERVPPAAGLLEPLDEHTCTLHMGAHSFDVLSFLIAIIGVDFEVREPAEFIDYLRRVGERCIRAAHPAGDTIQLL
jgi:predicted DNA-binding transcriptional regulator YafY